MNTINTTEYLTKAEVADRLHKTTRTIEDWMKQGLIPYIKLGRSILFHWPTVVEAINKNMKNAPQDNQQ